MARCGVWGGKRRMANDGNNTELNRSSGSYFEKESVGGKGFARLFNGK